MILARLVELADRLEDLPPPGYGRAFITKVIRLDAEGELVGVVSLAGEKKGKREGKTLHVPREQPQRANVPIPRLVADNPTYVLGKPKDKGTPAPAALRHNAYRELIEECARATKEASVEAIGRWLRNGGPDHILSQVDETDMLTFEVGGVYPTDLPSVRTFWAGRDKTGYEAVCLVTGKFGPVVNRMPAHIKGIPEGQMSGASLVSVNNPSGNSYGLDATLNSPVSKGAAEKIGNALNYLLSSQDHALRVGKTVYVFWTRDPVDFNPFSLLRDPQPADVQQLLTSAHSGKPPGDPKSADFYMLALSANMARVVVRDYHEMTLDVVKANLAEWFRKLQIVDPFGAPARPASIFRYATSLFREAKDMPAQVPTVLTATALAGRPLPEYLLGLAVKRNLAMQGPYEEFNNVRRLSTLRMALTKAIIEQEEGLPLEHLLEEHPDAAYHCGRLLAILERLQYAALRELNTTVVDRFYGAACTSPASILGNLVNDAQAHLGKLRKDHRADWHQRRLEAVLTAVGQEFPKTLSLPRQGLFALGFYHQKAADRAQVAQNKELQVEGDKE